MCVYTVSAFPARGYFVEDLHQREALDVRRYRWGDQGGVAMRLRLLVRNAGESADSVAGSSEGPPKGDQNSK